MKTIPISYIALPVLLPFFCFVGPNTVSGQSQKDHYYELSNTPTEYHEGALLSRMLDGLGFRFYHATDSLTEIDYAYRPAEDSRSVKEIITHVHSLTNIILRSLQAKQIQVHEPFPERTNEELRKQILDNIQQASALSLLLDRTKFEDADMVFAFEDGSNLSYPFWNVISGPLADALWHTGQIVMLRRLSGNPFDSGVNVLSGQVTP